MPLAERISKKERACQATKDFLQCVEQHCLELGVILDRRNPNNVMRYEGRLVVIDVKGRARR